ncbi:MAG: glycosyltransferase family 4 protein [Pricia sp.]
MKKKILFILHLPPPVTGAGLVGRYIKESEIINDSFESDYINLASSSELSSMGKIGSGKVTAVFKILAKVITILFKKDYDLCYMTLTARGLGFYKDCLMVATLKLFGQNIIYHFHNKGVKKNSNNAFNRMLYRFVFRNTQSILLSPELYDDFADYLKKENVYFCPNGIPDITRSDPKPSGNNAICRFFFLSNMMEEKGVYALLKACKLLKEKNLAFECHFVGAWSDVSELQFRELVNRYRIGAYIFAHGKKYGDDKVSYFEDADVFVFPSYYDCFPLVLLEAMQFALPIITTFEGGMPSIVNDGKTGMLIPQQNDRALAAAMEKLLHNPELRMQMGKAGRKRYEKHFTLSEFENNLKEILDGVVCFRG